VRIPGTGVMPAATPLLRIPSLSGRPALIIDEKAVSFGRDLSVDEIKEILKKYR
jgi:hypothetical protein